MDKNFKKMIFSNLKSAILLHIRKFTIEQGIGSMLLMRDMSEYRDCIEIFLIPKISQKFEILKAIGKLHLVNPDQISEVIADSDLSKLTKIELETFIKMRSDYEKSWSGKYY